MKCFHCEKVMDCAALCSPEEFPDLVWRIPDGGVVFSGGSNFGSELYDALTNGIYVDIVICDKCLKVAYGTERLKEYKYQDAKHT